MGTFDKYFPLFDGSRFLVTKRVCWFCTEISIFSKLHTHLSLRVLISLQASFKLVPKGLAVCHKSNRITSRLLGMQPHHNDGGEWNVLNIKALPMKGVQ